MNNLEKLHFVIKEYDLQYYWKIFFNENKSNDLPYHNLFHTQCVLINSYLICNSLNISKEDTRKNLISAIFHDFNHSGGKLTDDLNVKEAISSFLKYSKETNDTNKDIINIIKATQYPYIISESDLIISQKIIRDADLLQMVEPNSLNQVIRGLLIHELKVPYEKLKETQLNFIKGVKFYTDYAKDKFENQKEFLISNLDIIL